MKWLNCTDEPLKLYGLAVKEGEKFWRLPESLYNKVNDGVTGLSQHTAGACVKFRTDSPKVTVKVKLLSTGNMNHMPLSGQSGVGMYINGKFRGTARPADASQPEYEATLAAGGMNDYMFYLPLYNGVKSVMFGFEDEAAVEAPKPYKYEKPVLFYGSSITQGGCASQPGNAYCAILSRWLDCAHINLGFSGSARGEQNVAEYIGSLELSAFVMDYDHNAPSVEHLENTHYAFYETVRKAQPDLPIIFVTKPDFDSDKAGSDKRRKVVFATYEKAFKNGDRNVWFVDGETLFGTKDRDSCTVDTCHPNDLGFMRMAEGIYPTLKKFYK